MNFRLIFGIVIYVFLGWIICQIDAYESYTWYSGIWHGLFFVPNILKNLFWHTPYQAVMCTTSYVVFFRLFSIISLLSCLGLNHYDSRRKARAAQENDLRV